MGFDFKNCINPTILKQMKVVQINGSYGFNNSTGRTTKEMHHWLMEHKIKSYCFVSSINDDSNIDKNLFIFGNKVEKKMHALLSRVTGLQGYFSFYSTIKLIRNLRRINPEIIVLRVLHNNSINFPMLFKFIRDNNVNAVIVLHDCYYMTGHCMYFTKYSCTRWEEDCGNCPGIKEDIPSLFFDTSKKCLKDKNKWFQSVKKLAVVGVSDWIKNIARKSILKSYDIYRIYNWIDQSVFYPRSCDLRSNYLYEGTNKIILAVASKWTNEKGLAEIKEIANKIECCTILLVGAYSNDDKNLNKRIRCLGTISDPNILANLYSTSDVFVNPSIQETFGKTTAESICCGTPVVAYNSTASKELVGNCNGILVEPGDKEGFVKAVTEVLCIGKERYKNRLVTFAKSNFDINANMEQYIYIFSRLIESQQY